MLVRDILRRHARIRPDETAYVEGSRRLTWADLERQSRFLGASLRALGLVPGDRCGILAGDHLEMIVHWYACLRFGFVRTGINWRYSAQEMRHIVGDSQMRALVVQAGLGDVLSDELHAIEAAGVRLVGIGPDHGLEHDFSQLSALNDHPADEPELGADDDIALSYTSGTSGVPKGALLSQRGALAQLVAAPFSAGLRADDVILNNLPGSGFPIFIHTHSLSIGATTVMPGRYSAAGTVDLIEQAGVSVLFCVPTQLQAIVDAGRERGVGRHRLRLVIMLGSPVVPAYVESARELFGCEFQNWYGSTEATGVVTMLRPVDLTGDPTIDSELATSVGRPLYHVDIEVRDDSDVEVPRGTTGEICVRGDVLKGYVNNVAESERALRGGWLHTGDIGVMDERGFLHLKDRRSFMIVSGGYNVYPAVVERILTDHPAVEAVAVVGAEHPRWGEAVVAVVVPRSGHEVTADDLISYCTSRVGRWEVPKHVEFVTELPVGSTGKVQRKDVREWFRAEPTRLPWVADPAGTALTSQGKAR
jgi:acyl-CoA synthetase (AMP-forming)/AMP-acid ligase II